MTASTTPTQMNKPISPARLRQIEGTVVAAAAGKGWAEIALGEISDEEFGAFIRQRRALRLTDPVRQAKAATPTNKPKLPTFPVGVGSGSASSYNADPVADDRQMRGLARIEAALAAAAAG
jgi:hypothetical protein